MSLICTNALILKKGIERLIYKTSKHSLEGLVLTMVTARKSFQTFILKKAAVPRGKEVDVVRGGRCVLRPLVFCF